MNDEPTATPSPDPGTADSKPKPRVGWVDTGRGIAITLVVLYHAARWLSAIGIDAAGWQRVNEILSSLRMPLFFTLSGLFAASWVFTRSWRELLRTKIALFVWVFVVWEIVGAAFFVYGTALAGERVGIRNALWGLLISFIQPRREVWFLWALALFFVVAKACARLPAVAQLVPAAVASCVALSLWLNENSGGTGALKYYFFFLAGLHLRDLLRGRWVPRGAMVPVVILVWAAMSVALTVLGVRQILGLYFLNCLVGVFAGIAISRLLQRVSVLPTLGRQTLPIYVVHTSLIIIMIGPLVWLGIPGLLRGTPDVLFTPLLAAVAILLALWLHRVLSRTGLRRLYEPPGGLVDRVLPARDPGAASRP